MPACSEIVRSAAPASMTPRHARPRVVRLDTPFSIEASVALPLAVCDQVVELLVELHQLVVRRRRRHPM